jgi:hypothetical protein
MTQVAQAQPLSAQRSTFNAQRVLPDSRKETSIALVKHVENGARKAGIHPRIDDLGPHSGSGPARSLALAPSGGGSHETEARQAPGRHY